MYDYTSHFVIEAQGVEWVQVIAHFVKSQNTLPENAVMYTLNAHPVFYLDRTKFKAADLARLFGADPEAVEKAQVIRLKSLDQTGPLPNPTVAYSGDA